MKKIDVGCYYFPNYHPGDSRNTERHGANWSEWNLIKQALPRFAGHRQPKIPVWGYEDEAKPEVMARKIAAAADSGIDYFIFDWYHYSDGPFLEDCLDGAFLPAVQGKDFRFALMWANHDWLDIHPCGRVSRPVLYSGLINPEDFRKITDNVIEKYFKHPNYYLMDGCPYFSIYHIAELIQGLGGFAPARQALADFKARVKAAGFPGINLNAVIWGSPVLPGEEGERPNSEVIRDLGFDTVSSYVWIHHLTLPKDRPSYPYTAAMEDYFRAWDELEKNCRLPYYPNVSMGWDPSPRTIMSECWEPGRYPYTAVLSGNTPENFRIALERTKSRLEARGISTFSINCWNEWTEGSMLEPEAEYGTGYLDALKSVFGK